MCFGPVFLVYVKCTKTTLFSAHEKAPDGILCSAPVYDDVPYMPAVFSARTIQNGDNKLKQVVLRFSFELEIAKSYSPVIRLWGNLFYVEALIACISTVVQQCNTWQLVKHS